MRSECLWSKKCHNHFGRLPNRLLLLSFSVMCRHAACHMRVNVRWSCHAFFCRHVVEGSWQWSRGCAEEGEGGGSREEGGGSREKGGGSREEGGGRREGEAGTGRAPEEEEAAEEEGREGGREGRKGRQEVRKGHGSGGGEGGRERGFRNTVLLENRLSFLMRFSLGSGPPGTWAPGHPFGEHY